MDKRYQVFVSSTYADLKQERQRVIQALMEMDCIPAGMELFPAADDEQWAFIKRIIDDCDYYLIIIGGRYGSLTPEGISYTEKEFNYALERGLKIIALLHEEPDSIPVNKSDIDPVLRQKLKAFRDKVATNRLVKFWKTADELPGMVALSLSKTIKTYPAVGWVRASLVASQDVLVEINELRKENNEIRLQLANFKTDDVKEVEDIADFDASIIVNGEVGYYYNSNSVHRSTELWKAEFSWRKLFSLLAPYLMDHPSDNAVKGTLANVLADDAKVREGARTLDDQQFKTITIQLKALGLVNVNYTGTTKGGMGLFWSLTDTGEKVMTRERIVKKPSA
ncbi:MAG TPA: DUF4062 domain-containing protein [Verrucomicrobiae bacterium]|nr:DUF4062 domain-containing protein [Verrucomicrobiae bacterium]